MNIDKRHIQVLAVQEARKIAAGEVVERPASLIREFMDNAIDAGAKNIEVAIQEGGCSFIEVIDDGCGMEKSDLEICCQDHATSKIRCLDDLNTVSTLGFRGEALAAAASVASLEIVTSTDGKEAWKITAGASTHEIEQSRRVKGTSVRAAGIFDTIPARKRFLKKSAAEGALCKQAFIDKALAFPPISFRFSQDNKLKLLVQSVPTYKERFAYLVTEQQQESFLHEIVKTGEGFTIHIVLGGQEIFSTTRRQQYVFVNGRRVQEFSLQQALEYGTQGWFPNGTHPVGAVFINIDPALVDFNVHPAKREVRWRNASLVHHAITESLQNFVRHFYNKIGRVSDSKEQPVSLPLYVNDSAGPFYKRRQPSTFHTNVRSKRDSSSLAMEALLKDPPEFAKFEPVATAYQIRYIGQLFNLFLLVEKEGQLFIIDQHAAHERILYDKFISEPITRQELLVSIPVITESAEDDNFLEQYQVDLALLGIGLAKEGEVWRIKYLPANWHKSDTETVREILELKSAHEDMLKRWAATLACHTAIKDGNYIDRSTASALAQAVLELPDPHCPHGRPIFFVLSREQLFSAVHRHL